MLLTAVMEILLIEVIETLLLISTLRIFEQPLLWLRSRLLELLWHMRSSKV
jgi:hypothetical protein